MCRCLGGVGGERLGGLDEGLEWWGGVMSVSVVSPDSLCRWQVHVSVYCAGRIPAHLRCTQCSILLHLIDISFIPCICLWQISQIQTCLCVVVGPGFGSTSPTFMRSRTSHPAGPHGRLAPKKVNRAPIAGVGGFDPISTAVCNRGHSSTAYGLCRLEPFGDLIIHCRQLGRGGVLIA